MVDNMEWFNVFGLIFIAVIMIPNVVFAIKCKDGFDNKWNNKYVEVTEQVGRLGCFGFMIINIPGTWFGWWSDEAFALYLIVDTILVMLYCAIWIICFKKNSVFRALALSIIPSMLFLFSGIMSRSVLLIIASVLFAPSHIVISYKNVKWYLQIQVEQNRCAMACQGYGAVFLYTLIKSSGNQVLQVVLLSHHNQQSNRIDIPTAYDKNTIELPFWQAVLLC